MQFQSKIIALLFLLLFSAISGSAGELSRDQVTGLVTKMLKSWETGDFRTFSNSFTSDAVFAYPGARLSKPELLEMFNKYQQDNKEIKIYIGAFVIEDNRFAAQYQFAATDRKTGKRQAVGTAIAGIVRDGKLAVYKEYYDQHVINWQAEGRLPLDEGQIFPCPASQILGPERIN